MNETVKKAFGIVTDKVFVPLRSQGFSREKVDSSNENETVALFIGESIAYSVIYYADKMHFVMRSCSMTDDGPDNEWKSMATWMFNPETDSDKEADSIGNDFAEAVSTASAVKRVKQAKKKKSDEGNADPLFLAKRFVTLFPELKDSIRAEQERSEVFRGVFYTRSYIVPRINDLLKSNSKAEINKVAQLLSAQYNNGDMDTRSIINIVILNSVEEKYIETLKPLLSEELQKSWKYAIKFKGKKVRPEKPKKKKRASFAERLK